MGLSSNHLISITRSHVLSARIAAGLLCVNKTAHISLDAVHYYVLKCS